MDHYQKCERILRWSVNKTRFDTTFIEDVMSYYDERGEFTLSQENAIDNIIRKFNIKLSI